MKRAGLFIIHLAVGADRRKRKTPPTPAATPPIPPWFSLYLRIDDRPERT